MIPQNLLLAFLSLQGQERILSGTSPAAQVGVNIIEHSTSPATGNRHEAKTIKDVEVFYDIDALHDAAEFQQSFGETEDVKVYRFPFNEFSVGQYNERGLVHKPLFGGSVQITTNTTSYLWSLPDSYPHIIPWHQNTKVLGTYPARTGITVNFEKNWKEVHITLGVLVEGKFVNAPLIVASRINRRHEQKRLELTKGVWTKFVAKAPAGTPDGQGIDHINFFYLKDHPRVEGASAPRLIIESLSWS